MRDTIARVEAQAAERNIDGAPDHEPVASTSPAHILVIDDDPIMLRMVGQMLADQGDVSFATCAEDALALLESGAPDVILLDAEMPVVNGAELCRTIKRDPSLAAVPVIFVTSHRDPGFEVTCFDLGAVDFIHKPVLAPVLIARVSTQVKLKRMADELRQIARTDSVTGCATRRVFDEKLQDEWTRMRRSQRPLSLLLLDIDHFKLFNDHYGHQAGDACLRAFARILLEGASRGTDLVARYGGEEFVVLLPETDAAGAQAVAHNLLELLQRAAIPHAVSPLRSHVSASIGFSTCQPTAAFSARRTDPPPSLVPTASDLIAAADKALYEAKRAGRAQSHYLALGSVAKPMFEPRD